MSGARQCQQRFLFDQATGLADWLLSAKRAVAVTIDIFSVVVLVGVEREVRVDHVMERKRSPCGCARRLSTKKRRPVLHKNNLTHGMSGSALYNRWCGMQQRCNNPNNQAYAAYGARGITVCARWAVFQNFLQDTGHPPDGATLERIDNDKGYSPENCRWATREEQQNNRRTNRWITLGGVTKTITEWSRLTGIHHNTITQRIDGGATPERALTKRRMPSPSVLSEQDVLAIRAQAYLGPLKLAAKYGVSPSNISAITSRRSWKHLP